MNANTKPIGGIGPGSGPGDRQRLTERAEKAAKKEKKHG